MRRNNNILKRVQGLPVEVLRKVKNFLEYSIQIDLIQNTPYKYVEMNKTPKRLQKRSKKGAK